MLAYRFVDVHKMDKLVNVKEQTYGSKFEIDQNVLTQIKDKTDVNTLSNNPAPTVLINHARASLKSR